MSGRLRLLHLREQTEAIGQTMESERGRFAALARDEAKPRAVWSFNLFQTPEHIANQMADLLMEHVPHGGKILEPSAGLGRLYRATRDAGHDGQVVMVEQSPDCCRELYELTRDDRTAQLRQGDFLSMEDIGLIDGVIMNPPFKQGQDIKHIIHALAMLTPGGFLVSLCFDGVKQNQYLRPIADTWETLPVDTFKQEGTRASVVMLTIKKATDNNNPAQ